MRNFLMLFAIAFITACAGPNDIPPEVVAQTKTQDLCQSQLGYEGKSNKYHQCYEKNYAVFYQTAVQEAAFNEQRRQAEWDAVIQNQQMINQSLSRQNCAMSGTCY